MKSDLLHPGTKRAAVLRTLIERREAGLNCFEAVRWCHDYVLRSTISDLQRQYGLRFCRKPERVLGYAGSVVDCVRYWLDEEGRRHAAALLPDVGAVDEPTNALEAA